MGDSNCSFRQLCSPLIDGLRMPVGSEARDESRAPVAQILARTSCRSVHPGLNGTLFDELKRVFKRRVERACLGREHA